MNGDGEVETPDAISPVIILIGEKIITIPAGDTYIDPGAIAIDDVDGNITDQIVVVNPCDVNIPGTYIITYNVIDSAGNSAIEVTRKVIVRDPTKPFISLIGEERMISAVGELNYDPGATAVDDIDGDITHLIVVVDPVDPWVAGTYVITYNVTDSSGNSAIEVTREVIVDGTPPVISLVGSPSIVTPASKKYRDPGATALDDVDGDISGRISVNNPVNTNILDTYIITYNVNDTAGNIADEVTREVIVRDMTPPEITRQGSSKIILTVGTPFTDPGATAQDNVDGDISNQIVVDNPVDTNVPGIYTITYNVSDDAGNSATEVTRGVNVVIFHSTFGRVAGRSDTGSEIIEAPGDNYVVVGTSSSAGVGRPDIWVIKIDGNGDEVWNKVFGTNKSDSGYSLCLTSDGGYAILGSSQATPPETWVIKLDENGDEIWRQVRERGGSRIIENSKDELLLAGNYVNPVSGDVDVLVIKLDKFGDELWSRTYGGTGNDTGADIIETTDGNYIVAGATTSFGAGSADAWIIKTDENGNEIWAKSFGGPEVDTASSIIETSDGNYTFAGSTYSYGGGGRDIWVVTIDQNGNEIWNTAIGTGKNEWGADIAEASTGGYLITGGKSESLGTGEDELLVVKLDQSGNVEWNGIFGGWRDESGKSIIATSDGYCAVVGTTKSFGDSYGDIWVIKF